MRVSKLTILLLTFAGAACLSLTMHSQTPTTEIAKGPSAFVRIGPGGGPEPGTPPTCDPDTESCYCDPEFSPGSQLLCYEHVSPPPPDPVPTCYCALYSRPIAGLGYVIPVNHTFWFTTDAYYFEWITDGFPSGNCLIDCGYLNGFETYGIVGQGGDSLSSGTRYWDTGQKNVSTCKMSFGLQAFVQSWPNYTTHYGITGVSGPNSNSFSSRGAAFAGIPVPVVPQSFAPGWGK